MYLALAFSISINEMQYCICIQIFEEYVFADFAVAWLSVKFSSLKITIIRIVTIDKLGEKTTDF